MNNKEKFFHGGDLNQASGFAFWARQPSRAIPYSDGKPLMFIEIDLGNVVEDGIELADVLDLENDEVLEQQYRRISELLADGAEAVACDDGIAIPLSRTTSAVRISHAQAYELFDADN